MSIDKIAQSLGVRTLDEALAESRAEDDNLDAYGELVEYDPETGQVEIIAPENNHVTELLTDIDKAKSNIQNVIDEGQKAFSELIAIAKQSETAQAFQVAANMMESLIAANKTFIEVAEKKREVKDEDGGVSAQPTNITQNNLIVTTDSLLEDMLARKRSK